MQPPIQRLTLLGQLMLGFSLICGLWWASGSRFFKTFSAAAQTQIATEQDLIRRSELNRPGLAELRAKAQAGGAVRVIVGLRVAFQPEGRLNQAAVQAQRRTIGQAQTALLARLPGVRADSVKRLAALPLLALEVEATGLEQLRNDPAVTTVEEDALHYPTLAESVPLIGAPAAWGNGFAGAGQTLAILDTGVDKTHPFLLNKVVAEGCFSTNSSISTSVCADTVSQSSAPGSGVHCNAPGCDHGTHVAGIAAGKGASFSGVARDANLIAIQVFSRVNGCPSNATNCLTAFTSDILLGLQRVQQLSSTFKIAAVNLSLGGGQFTANCDAQATAFKMAIDNLRSLDIATIVASGNESHIGALSSPACISSAISVGAVGDGASGAPVNVVSNFSNSATFLHLLAPGDLINSAVPGGTFKTFRGTSQAAPHVAGAWAVLKSKTPAATVPQVLQALLGSGLSVTDARNNLARPRLRVDAAVNALGGTACHYAITPTTQSFAANGGNGVVNVTATSGCAWTATSNTPWLTLNSGNSGTGNGTVSYTVAANASLERTGTLFIAGQTFNITQEGLPSLAVDDGSFENALGLISAGTRYGVNRLTPASYPATINRIAIFFPSGVNLTVGANITLLSGTNSGGTATLSSPTFTTTPAMVQALDQFNIYDIPPVTIESGDFLVGFQRALGAQEFPFALDETPPSKQRSYLSTNGTTFTATTGNFGIRALLIQGPLVSGAGAVIAVESCQPLNNAPDPNEAVLATFALRNLGNVNLNNLVATLQSTGGVTAPSGPQTYGALLAGGPAVAKTFAFTASGACGSTLTATLSLQDGATNLGTTTFSFKLGTPKTTLTESFDSVTAPALPANWTSTLGSGTAPLWVTVATGSDSLPNHAFATDPSATSDVRLDSPNIAITTAAAQVSFRNNYDTDPGYDGGVLEISIAGAAFTDIISAGGSFVTGGYSASISLGPLSGRMAWTGKSGGYLTTTVNLPATAAGKSIRLRWRFGSDSSVSGVGWRIDGIQISDGNTCATECATSCLTQGTLSASGQTFPVSGGAGTISLTLPQNCAWTATSNASWLTINAGASGTGSGTINFSAAPNNGSEPRTGTLTIAGQVFTVTQQNCGFALTPVSQNFDPAGGNGSLAVTAAAGCTWTATSNAAFITINSGASGMSNGTVNFTVAPNTGTSARTGTLTVAGLTFTVNQAACTFAIAPTTQAFGATGGTGSAAVAAQGSCNWTATSNAPWLSITAGASGSGNGTVTYTAEPLSGTTARTGTLTIAGQTLTVTQVPFANDVGAAGFDLPSTVKVGLPITIRVRVTNFGSTPKSNFPVSYQIDNEFPVTETFSETLAPLQTAVKSFNALWTPYRTGSYQLIARTQLNGDQQAANDAAQTAVQAGQAQYRGVWQGTTGNGRPVRFVVDENDAVVSLEVDIGVQIAQGTCIGTFRSAAAAPINNGQFETTLIAPGGIFTSGTITARGTLGSATAATGQVGNFTVNLVICGSAISFGTINVTGPSFTAQRQANCPTITALEPTSARTGTQVVIVGTNFTDVNAVKFTNNVAAHFVINDPTRITVTVPAGATAGPLTLSKPGCADVQTAAFTPLDSPAPTLTALNPNTLTAGGIAFTLNLTGTNFTPGSQVRWNGNARPTAYVSATQLMAALAASDLATAGTAAVTVFNPAPGGGTSAPQNFTIVSPCPTITVTPATLPTGTTGAAYNQSFSASGGATPYSFAVSAGTLPNGLTLSTAGVLTGTPTRAGSFNVTVRATDANGCAGTQTYALTINCPTITLAPTTLPDAPGGVAYSQTLTASGGTAPYSFAVTAGALPGGLTLTTGGVLAGTPNVAGTFNFTVTATDANGCTGTRSYTVNITVTLGAQTRVLYVLNDNPSGNQIYGYAVNETTGALTLLAGFPISTGGNGLVTGAESERLAIDRANQRLYAINAGSNTVSAYTINSITGALTPLPFSPISLDSGIWRTVAVHPGGSPLVVGDSNGRLASYQITTTTATVAVGSPYNTGSVGRPAAPISATFSQDGKYVYTGGLVLSDPTFAGFNVNPVNGTLTALSGSPFDSGRGAPRAYATDVVGRIFMANTDAGQVRVFTTASGIPSSVSGNNFTSGLTETVYGLLHMNGFYLAADRAGNRVGVYRINGSDNATTLTAVTGSPFAAGGTLTNVLALNQTGTLLFAANASSRNLTTFSINPATGALIALGTQSLNTLGTSGGITGMAYLAQPCPTITLSPSTLPSGTVSTAYNQTIAASPSANYNFSVSAGALPAGLSLNAATGALTGTPTAAGTFNFTITALSFGPCSGSQAYTLVINNPAPALAGLNPATATAGAGALTLTITGSNFVNSSTVRWNGADRPTTFVSATQLTANIPASDLATAGMAQVTVFTPAPGGGMSGAQTFTINNPVPTTTALNPTSAIAGGASLTLTVTGTNFVNGSVVRWNGSDRPTTFVSATQLTAALTASDLATAGTASVTVFNPAPGGGTSNAQSFTINNPVPTLTALNPNTANAGSQSLTLTVNGTNFVSGARVRWNGNERPTTFVNSTQLTASLTAADLAAAGTAQVTVLNPAPGGGASGALAFTINNLAPSVLNLTPNVAIAGSGAFTLTVNGSNFVSDSVVRWNGNNRPTTFVSTTRLTAAIPAADIAAAGTARVTVFNPAPGGGASTEATLTIANPVATVNAASFLAGEFAADSIVSAFGASLATAVATAETTPLPTELAGTSVKVRDSAGAERLAQLFFVAPTQINFVLPLGTAVGAATLTITSGNGALSVGTLQIAAVAPGLFSANANGQGVAAAVALRVKADGTQSYELVAQFDQALGRFVPLPLDLGPEGEQVFLILFGTGFRGVTALSNVNAQMGGLGAEVVFAGTQGSAGLDQANVRIPRGLAGRGVVDVRLLVEGKAANTVQVSIK